MEFEIKITPYGLSLKMAWAFLSYKLQTTSEDAAQRVEAFLVAENCVVLNDIITETIEIGYVGNAEPVGQMVRLMLYFLNQ